MKNISNQYKVDSDFLQHAGTYATFAVYVTAGIVIAPVLIVKATATAVASKVKNVAIVCHNFIRPDTEGEVSHQSLVGESITKNWEVITEESVEHRASLGIIGHNMECNESQ